MHLSGLRGAALTAVLLVAASGCGSSGAGDTGKISVHLMDAPGDYQQVNVDVQEVLIHGPEGWVSLGTPDRVINLLDFTNGFTTTLINEFGIEAGHYTQLRLVLGSRNSVLLEGETEPRPLTVPSGLQSGIKLNVNFDVEPGTTRDVYIDFDAHRSVFVHETGASAKYILRPVVFCYDQLVTGSITGIITDVNTGQPVVGALVTAQTTAPGALPTVARATVTDASGRYVLSHLFVDRAYHVVSQAVAGDAVYGPHASAGIAVNEANPVVTHDFGVFQTLGIGRAEGSITPAADAGMFDEVLALQTFNFGEGAVLLQVRSVNVPATVSGVESYAVENLPAGLYAFAVVRDLGDPPTASAAGPVTSGVPVMNGATATVNLTAPTLPTP